MLKAVGLLLCLATMTASRVIYSYDPYSLSINDMARQSIGLTRNRQNPVNSMTSNQGIITRQFLGNGLTSAHNALLDNNLASRRGIISRHDLGNGLISTQNALIGNRLARSRGINRRILGNDLASTRNALLGNGLINYQNTLLAPFGRGIGLDFDQQLSNYRSRMAQILSDQKSARSQQISDLNGSSGFQQLQQFQQLRQLQQLQQLQQIQQLQQLQQFQQSLI